MNFPRIEPTEAIKEPVPPCSGNWIRDKDGGIRPADEATAITAGLIPNPADQPAGSADAVDLGTTGE